jgi:hypothetical protein
MANPMQTTMDQEQQTTLMVEPLQTSETEQPGEGVHLYHNQILDELPGAAFAAATLVWVITSFGRLIW